MRSCEKRAPRLCTCPASSAPAPARGSRFKPMGPAPAAEATRLERRAAEMAALTKPASVAPTEAATASTLVGTEEALAGAESTTAGASDRDVSDW